MFHLTRYKYVFFGISLAIIIPGLLALIFWGLNLGIDFTGGSTVNVVFASNTVTANQIQAVMVKDKAQDVNVLATKPLDIKNTPTPDRYAFITFDHPIGKNVETEVLKRLRTLDSSAQITKTIYTVAYPADTKTPTAQMVVLFDKAMKQGDITKALQNLPKSDPAPVETASNATPTPNATPKATGSATAGATATSAATATPKATASATASATATATATPAPSAQQHEVAVTKVTPGANNQTYQINTQTTLDTNAVNTLTAQLIHEFGPAYSPSHESVGGSVSSDTTRDAILAVLFASAAIMIYISIAFRKVGSLRQSFRFGASAIIALLHDALVILGLWAIFGHFFGFKVDSLFLTAVLTVIGFSVHDTIVVFDRIRENMGRRTAESFDTVVNASLIQTMTRSLNTSLTVLFTLAALTLFGGESIREFTLALLIGIASGTFSSIFNASMILDVWETGEYRRWFRRKPETPAKAKPKRELVSSR